MEIIGIEYLIGKELVRKGNKGCKNGNEGIKQRNSRIGMKPEKEIRGINS